MELINTSKHKCGNQLGKQLFKYKIKAIKSHHHLRIIIKVNCQSRKSFTANAVIVFKK